MLSVIVDARGDARKLPVLLAQLTAGAVDGLVREVLIVAAEDDARIAEICEDTGADRVASIGAAAARARSAHLLAVPADFRLRDGWIGALTAFLASGGHGALVSGFAPLGLAAAFRKRPWGVLVGRARAAGLEDADLQRLRRELGLAPARIG